MNQILMDVMKRGGDWLGTARNWLLWNKDTGGRLIWGSEDEVRMTMKDCEEICLAAAAAERERCAKIAEAATIPGHSIQAPSCIEIARKIREGLS